MGHRIIYSVYLELGKYDDALEYFLKSLHIYDSLGISIGVAIIQDNIGSLYFKQNLWIMLCFTTRMHLKCFNRLKA